ncbi:MAG: hypothetical protein HZB76_06670 [Chlamydiae bacterium]|nr:hypothetical protein [Chlamydiota bacterium]
MGSAAAMPTSGLTQGINYARIASNVFKTGKTLLKATSTPGYNTGAMKCKIAFESAIIYVQLCSEFFKENKVFYKGLETFMRIFSIPVGLTAASSLPQDLRDETEFKKMMGEGVLSTIRAGSEAALLQDKVYLGMSDEQLADVKDPIWESETKWGDPELVYDSEGPDEYIIRQKTTWHIVGYKARFTRAELQEDAAQAEKMSNILSIAEILINTGLVARAIKKISGFVAPEITPVNYQAMATIPAHLHNDPVLRSIAICSLTNQPTRDPVKDPTSGLVYERAAITQHIALTHASPSSPTTPLTVEQLVECPALKTLIDNQLDVLSAEVNQAAARIRKG